MSYALALQLQMGIVEWALKEEVMGSVGAAQWGQRCEPVEGRASRGRQVSAGGLWEA